MDAAQLARQQQKKKKLLARLAELRSFERAATVLKKVLGQPISANKIRRLAKQVDQTPGDVTADRVVSEGPQRVLHTALSSMACSDDFGPMMHLEAEATAFVGDGLKPGYEEIIADIRDPAAINIDETGRKEDGRRAWSWKVAERDGRAARR